MYTSRQPDMLQNYHCLRVPCFLVYCGCLLPLMAQAQDRRPRILEEIVVTAQKREERMIDVPMSISAISSERLAEEGIDNALDLSFMVPSMSVAEVGSGMQMVIIRGISSIRGTAPLIGTYLDDIPLSSPPTGAAYTASPDLRVIDLERVEVLKGPQGTLFGEGAAGGVLRYITKDPDLGRFGGEVGTELSNTTDGDWSEEVTGILNVPLAKEVFGIRIAAQYQNTSGWIDQPATEARSILNGITGEMMTLPASVARENINDSEVKHVRLKALLAPSENLRIKGTAEIHRNKGGANNIVNRLPYGNHQFVQAGDRTTPSDYFDEYDLFNVTATYDFGFAELLSSSSYAKTDGNQRYTQVTPEEPVPFFELDWRGRRQTSITSQEFRLTSTTQGPFRWTLGAAYKDAEGKRSFSYNGFDIILNGGAAGEMALMNLSAGQRDVSQSESWAGFADISYLFANRFEVGGGLRYFEDSSDGFGIDPAGLRTIGPPYDDSKLTYRAYIKYAMSDVANVYASVGTGFRSGGATGQFVIDNGGPASYDPDETIFYELGTKLAVLDGRMRLDAALFYGEYQNMQEDIGRIGSGPSGETFIQYTDNGQDAEVRGIELNVDWAATEQLTLGLSGDVTDTEITFIDPSYIVSTLAYRVGDPINYVPEYGVSARADYRFQWTDAMPGFVLVSFNRKGESRETQRHRYGNIINNDQFVTPEVSFLNASVGGDLNGWEWNLFGQNLLNEDGIVLPGVTGISIQARPRTVGVGVRRSF